MEIKYKTDVCPHILITSFLAEEELEDFNQAFYEMYSHSVSGSFHKNKQEIVDSSFKARSEFYFRDFKLPQIQKMEMIWWNAFWKKDLRKFYHEAGGIFSYLNLFNGMSLMGSFYGDNCFYKEHSDASIMTAIFFHQDEKLFDGGGLILNSGNDWSESVGISQSSLKIPYKKNTLIIFPSRYHHEVEMVTNLKKPGPEGMRLSIQCFFWFTDDGEINPISEKLKLINS